MPSLSRYAALMLLASPIAAIAEPMTMMEATERLQLERGSAVTCARVMKRHLPEGDAGALSRAELSYEEARTEMMAAIAYLEAALIEDQEEEGLTAVTKRLERGSELREAFCADALALVPPADDQKDVIEAAIKLAGSLIEAATTIWSKSEDLDEARRTNLRTALDDAKWPAFEDI